MTHALGRVVQHDPRSRQFGAALASDLRTVKHRRFGPILDQGNLGSCTGNALAGAINTAPLHKPRRILHEPEAVALYSLATQLDGAPGTYPPDDTGSSGLAVCKAGVNKGYLSSYRHAFGLDQTLAALVLQPVIVGTTWTQDMFTPDSAGFVHPGGNVAGGHEYELVGLDVVGQFVWAANSWGTGWGLKGFFKLSFADLGSLLADQGDCTVPVSA
jgi:hypothetical protein